MSQSTHLSTYRQLAQRLDTIPNGFPATESGVELKLLAKLYTPEQAELAAVMRLTPEPAEAIAARVGWEPAAAYNALKDMARLALRILRQATEAGLVHSSANVQKGHGYICNCCCGILRGLTEFGNAEAMARSNFHAAVDGDLCIACATCLEVCPFGALSLPGDIVEVDLCRCMGCGLCVPACPSEALSLLRKPETEITPPPLDEETWLMERARSRGIPLHEIL